MTIKLNLNEILGEDRAKAAQKVVQAKRNQTETGQPATPVFLNPEKRLQGPGGMQVSGPGPAQNM